MGINSALGSSALLPAGLGFRNVLINGDFKVWQRGTSITGYAYTADRWLAYNAAAVNTISRQSTSLNGFPYCARVQRNSGATNTGATYLVQAVESINGYQFQGKTATFSFYARAGANFSSASSVLTANIETSTGTDQSYIAAWAGSVPISSTKTLTTSWQLFTVTGVVPTTANQVAVSFSYTPVGTAGAADYFEITGVQLEQNYQPTPFEQRPIGTELALCQRYFYKVDFTAAGFINGFCDSTTSALFGFSFPQEMRSAPSLSPAPTASNYEVRRAGVAASACTALVIGSASANGTRLQATTGATLTAGQGVILSSATGSQVLYFSSEL
jgi:hypothetical protein